MAVINVEFFSCTLHPIYTHRTTYVVDSIDDNLIIHASLPNATLFEAKTQSHIASSKMLEHVRNQT